MSAPQHIADVLAGPHIKTLIHDGDAAIVMAEPLRFISLDRIGEIEPCAVCNQGRRSACSFSRCPRREARS